MNKYRQMEMVRLFGQYLGQRQGQLMPKPVAPYSAIRRNKPAVQSTTDVLANLRGNIANRDDIRAFAQELGVTESQARRIMGLRGFQFR